MSDNTTQEIRELNHAISRAEIRLMELRHQRVLAVRAFAKRRCQEIAEQSADSPGLDRLALDLEEIRESEGLCFETTERPASRFFPSHPPRYAPDVESADPFDML